MGAPGRRACVRGRGDGRLQLIPSRREAEEVAQATCARGVLLRNVASVLASDGSSFKVGPLPVETIVVSGLATSSPSRCQVRTMTGDRMGTFKIVWKDPKDDETVDADKFQDEGDWITLLSGGQESRSREAAGTPDPWYRRRTDRTSRLVIQRAPGSSGEAPSWRRPSWPSPFPVNQVFEGPLPSRFMRSGLWESIRPKSAAGDGRPPLVRTDGACRRLRKRGRR